MTKSELRQSLRVTVWLLTPVVVSAASFFTAWIGAWLGGSVGWLVAGAVAGGSLAVLGWGYILWCLRAKDCSSTSRAEPADG